MNAREELRPVLEKINGRVQHEVNSCGNVLEMGVMLAVMENATSCIRKVKEVAHVADVTKCLFDFDGKLEIGDGDDAGEESE